MSANLNEGKVDKSLRSCIRQVIHRSHGNSHGAITRLMSPGDAGQIVKPFVLFDDVDIPFDADWVFGMHPHSGVAALTLILTGSVWVNDTVGTTSVVNAGDIEWMQAGSGAWHESARRDRQPLRGLQLSLALPPHLEHATPQSRHICAGAVPQHGPAAVIMGTYEGVTGPVPYDERVTYLHVALAPDSTWIFTPPAQHTVAWIYVYHGRLQAEGDTDIVARELIVFEYGSMSIILTTQEGTGFVLGSAVAHPHALVATASSVHTSQRALDLGLDEIARIGRTLPSHCFKWLSAQSGRLP